MRVLPSSAWSAAALIALFTAITTWPLALRLTDSLPGDYGDPLFVTWAMGWVSATLTDALRDPTALSRLWDANIFFPEPQTLAFSEHFLGQSVLTLPVYWVSGNLLLSYNVAFLASFFLTGLGTFLLTRALTGNAIPALIAAAIATFNEYRLVSTIGHLHILSFQWMPFALYALHRYFETDARRYLALAAAALLALNLSSIYHMAFCAPLILLFVLFELSNKGRWRVLRVWLELWATAALVVVATLPVMLPYIEVQQRLGIQRSLAEVVQYSATIDQYGQAFPGLVPALVLALVGLVGGVADGRSTTRRLALMSFVLVVVAFWFSLGPVIQFGGERLAFPALYQVLQKLPGYDGLRVPSRFASLFLLFLGILAGLGAAVLERRWPRIARAAVIPATIAWVLWVAPSPLPLNQPLPSEGLVEPPAFLRPLKQPPSIYQAVDSLRPGVILVEFPFGDAGYDLRYMYFAAGHRRRLLNGYSGIFPPSYVARQRVLARPTLDPEAAARAIQQATHAIVHRTAWDDNSGVVIGAWLEAFGARVIAEHYGSVLYELPVREELAGG